MWLQAFRAHDAARRAFRLHQLHRMLGITYKSAWFMSHRIREAMRTGGLEPMGGAARSLKPTKPISARPRKAVIATRSGRPFTKNGIAAANKRPIVSLVERGGNVRSFHVAAADAATVAKIVRRERRRESAFIPTKAGSTPASATIRRARNGQPLRQGIRSRRRNNQYSRRLFFDLQARHERRLSALRREASAPLSRGI